MASDHTTLNLQDADSLALAQALAKQLSISPIDWHRLNTNRQVRAKEQVAAALVYLLKDQPEEALPRLEQAIGWLNRSIKAPPCPTHGARHELHLVPDGCPKYLGRTATVDRNFNIAMAANQG